MLSGVSLFLVFIIIGIIIQIVMSEEKNQLRLTLDLISLKQHEFTAQLYFVVRPISALNMKNYKSSTQAITNARAEIQINNIYKAYLFQASRSELRTLLAQQLLIELWHYDRIKKDILLGIARIPLSQIFQQPIQKTKEGFAFILDAWLPIDQVDDSEKPIKKIGTLRAKLYLEDLGPVSLLKQKGFDIKNFIDEQEIPISDPKDEQQFNRNVLPSEKYGNTINDQKRLQLNQLEHQVVWELQTWKKAEEARTRLVLKQKQAEFWMGLSEQQKKSDIEKEKQFKKIEANLLLIENKLKAKLNQLTKRENKILLMEQELQSKIGEISREVFLKDQEIQKLKRKHKQEKTAAFKQKNALDLQLNKLRDQNAKLKVDLELALKEDDKAPINILKNELNHKITEIKALRKQLQNCMETKEQFKESYEKMKKEVIERGRLLEEKSEQLSASKNQISLLKRDIKHLEEKLVYMKQQQFYANNYGYGGSNEEDEAPLQFASERDRLIYKRREMLEGGNYTVNDPLIKEIDKKIAALH